MGTRAPLLYCVESVEKIFSALALAVAFAGLSQAAAVGTPPPKPATPDSIVEHRIQAKFAKSKINAEHFTVSVHGGIATIEGKTNVIQHKGVATRLAKTGGAVAVKNHIQVSDAAKAKAAAGLARATVGPPKQGASQSSPSQGSK
jgi:hypothetical protein